MRQASNNVRITVSNLTKKTHTHKHTQTHTNTHTHTHTHTHTRLTAFFQDYLGKPVPERKNRSGFYWSNRLSGSGISWAICKSASRSRQTTMPATYHSVFYRPDALPAAQPTASKHWRHKHLTNKLAKTSTVHIRWASGSGNRIQTFCIHSNWLYTIIVDICRTLS